MLYTPHHYVLQVFILFIVKTPAQGQECLEERWSTLIMMMQLVPGVRIAMEDH